MKTLPLYFIKICDMKIFVLLIVSSIVLSACSGKDYDRLDKAAIVAKEFAQAYFDYDFKQARTLVTEDSQKWLLFASSNITEQEIDALNNRSKGATIDVKDIEHLNDTIAVATLTVENYLKASSIGRAGQMTDTADEYRVTLVERNGRWLVRMEGLPRNEKHSHG